MSRRFSLAGLLRIREIEEGAAKGRMASANGALAASLESVDGLHSYLRRADADPQTSASLAAVAASRASAAAMLGLLEAEAQAQAEQVESARAELRDARSATMGLEKLKDKHQASVSAQDRRDEQLLLDEAATARWQHQTHGSSPR